MEQGGPSSSLASKVTAKEFVPLPPGLSNSGASTALAKSTSSASLRKTFSSSSLSATAVNAPVFVPGTAGAAGAGRPSALDAKPFVPGAVPVVMVKQAGGAAGKPPKGGSPARPPPLGRAGAKQQPPLPPPLQLGQPALGLPAAAAAQPSGRAPTPDLGLPEGDDLLGMTAVTPGDSQDVASQAAEMFRALNPNPQGGGRGRPGPQQQPPQRSPRPSGGRGGLPPPGFSAPGPPVGGRGGQGQGMAGRGRGRGRRAGPAPNRAAAQYLVGPGRMQKAGLFIADSLRQELQHRAYLIQAQVNPETEGDLGLPDVIQQYHTLYPLEDLAAAAERPSPALVVRTQVMKGISRIDGQAYALRRVDPRQVIPTADLLAAAEDCVERWGALSNHPNVAGLREAFIAAEMEGVPALFFAYDYHPGWLTLEQAHIHPTQTAQGLMRNPPSEEQLWSYTVQLCCVLRAVHSAGLAVRPPGLAPSKVLLSSTGRVRLGCVGLPEALAADAGGLPPPGSPEVAGLQRQDLSALGNTLLVLACAGRGAAPSLDYVTAHYSREFCHIVAGLLAASEGSGFASWRSLAAALSDRAFDELEGAAAYGDALLAELARECENGRLLRVLARLSAVTERPELGGDAQWSETGDRYVAKLFRDFVFHQVNEEGAPLLDFGAMAESLNKVDAGVPEKILLLSRDEISMLVVSYADVKRCIQSSYNELRARASAGPGSGTGAVARSKSKPELRQQGAGGAGAEKGGGGQQVAYY